LPNEKLLNRRRGAQIITNIDEQTSNVNLIAFQIENYKKNFREIAILPKECSFGELALISKKPRAATIRAKTACYFAVLEKDDYKRIYGTIQRKQLNNQIEFLKSLPIFSKWSRDNLTKLSYLLTEQELKLNQKVMKEGEECARLYIVVHGQFEATKKIIIENKNEE